MSTDPGDPSSRSSTQNRERQNFEISETRRERIVLPGQVRRISVAVMVDGVTTTGPDGKPEWAPRPVEELETLRGLVQSAVGFDAERGDAVTIESLQFSALPEQGSLAERGGSGWLAANGARMAQIGVLGVIVLALIFFVLRPMMSRRPQSLPDLSGLREIGPNASARPEALGEMAGGDLLELPPASVTKIDRLREVIASRSEDSAAVLRAWIESPEPLKEPAQS